MNKKGKTYEQLYGKEKSKELRKKSSELRKGKHFSPKTEFKKGMVPWCKKYNDEEITDLYKKGNSINDISKIIGCHFSTAYDVLKKKNVSIKGSTYFNKGKTAWNKGRSFSKEVKEKMGLSSKKRWENPEYREKTIKAQLKGLMKRPTSFEKKIAELCIENSLPFVYTGDGRFLINFKNPDFTNYQDKIVMEVFYSWFKIRDYGSVENYKKHCIKKYNPAGWKVIFIDENEVNVNNWKELCLNKIN